MKIKKTLTKKIMGFPLYLYLLLVALWYKNRGGRRKNVSVGTGYTAYEGGGSTIGDTIAETIAQGVEIITGEDEE